jgi:ribonuclease T1
MNFGRMFSLRILAALGLIAFLATPIPGAERCEVVVRELNQVLHPRVDEKELFVILKVLNETDNRKLPPKFVTKNQARNLGWRPGTNLWGYDRLKGKSICGEADLDYRGGHRGTKRIVYSDDGLRMITVDHYKTFKEVPPCK